MIMDKTKNWARDYDRFYKFKYESVWWALSRYTLDTLEELMANDYEIQEQLAQSSITVDPLFQELKQDERCETKLLPSAKEIQSEL